MMDKIIIDGSHYFNIGVSRKERQTKQKINLHIMIFKGIEKAAKSQKIADTIDYAAVWEKVKKLSKNKYVLLEALAEDISKKLTQEYNSQVQVKIAKSIDGVEYAVKIERSAK